ncbi:MAG TPA: tetratricopeptide repeat protein [Vicinamibacteria bacterium]|nr:tetratricopeptide repeat protein [Vicinamibacteria bacterium]
MTPATALIFVLLSAASATPPVMVVPPEPPAAPASDPTLVGPPPEPAPAPAPASPADASWVAEAVSDLLPRALLRAGVAAVSRDDRLRAQAALEIPRVPLTRATSIRLAEALGASRLVVGTYALEGETLALSLRVLDATRGSLGPPVDARGPLETLPELVDAVAWDMALAEPEPPVLTREVFGASRPWLRFEALRSYGQGLAARNVVNKGRLYRRALALEPGFDEARLALGRLQVETGEFSAGHDTLARIGAASPQARAARFLQGLAQLEIGRYKEAAAVYASLARDETTPAVLNNQALALLRAGRAEPRASSLLRRAVEMEPASIDLLFNLSWALLSEGDPGAADFFLRDVLEREPLDAHGRVVLVWALRKAGRTKEADEAWKGVVTLSPGYEGLARVDLARRFERILPAERMLVLSRGKRTPAEVAAGLIGKAERLTATGDAAGALRELERAAYLDPAADRVHLLLARAYRATGQGDRAANRYLMTLWAQDDPSVRAELAAALKEMGRHQEARVEAEKVLRQDPQNETARAVLQR